MDTFSQISYRRTIFDRNSLAHSSAKNIASSSPAPSLIARVMVQEAPKEEANVKITSNLNLPSKPTPRVNISERDISILAALHTHQHLTAHHIYQLFWATEDKVMGVRGCRRRLQQMVTARIVRRLEQPTTRKEGRKPYVYALDKEGAFLLSERMNIPFAEIVWRPRSREEYNPFFDHTFARTDFKIALSKAIRREGDTLLAWETEKELKLKNQIDRFEYTLPSGRLYKTSIIPDDRFIIRRGKARGLFFLERDLGTETLEPTVEERNSWKRKILSYLAYYHSKEYAARYGDTPLRVLVVGDGEKRLQNMIETTFKAVTRDELLTGAKESRSMFWFAPAQYANCHHKVYTQPIWGVIDEFKEFEETTSDGRVVKTLKAGIKQYSLISDP